MAANTFNQTLRVYRSISWPRIHIRIPRKDLWVSAIIFLAGMLIPALMLFEILDPNLFYGLLGFLLTFFGGTFFFVRLGEIG